MIIKNPFLKKSPKILWHWRRLVGAIVDSGAVGPGRPAWCVMYLLFIPQPPSTSGGLCICICICVFVFCICPSCIFVFLCLYFIFVQPDVFLDLESRCLYCVDLIGEGQVQSIGSLDQPYSATFTKHQGFPPTNCFVCFKFVSFFKILLCIHYDHLCTFLLNYFIFLIGLWLCPLTREFERNP